MTSDEFIAFIQSLSPEWFTVPGDHSGCLQRTHVYLGEGWYIRPHL